MQKSLAHKEPYIFDSKAILTNKKAVYALALLMCLLWGSAFPAIKAGYAMFAISAEDTASKILFAGYRFFFAGILLLGLALGGRKKILLTLSDFGRVSIYGLLMTTIQYTFFYIGLSHTTGVKGSIINGTTTFFSVLFAHFAFASETLKPRVIIGCVVGFLGVVVVNINGGRWSAGFSLTGEGFVVMASVMLALAGVYGKIISQRLDAVVMTAWQLTIGGGILVVIGIGLGGSLHGFTLASCALYLYMILLSSVAFALYSALLKYNPVSVVSIFQFTVPLFGAVLSALFLRESILEWKNLAALFCVSTGIFIVTRVKR